MFRSQSTRQLETDSQLASSLNNYSISDVRTEASDWSSNIGVVYISPTLISKVAKGAPPANITKLNLSNIGSERNIRYIEKLDGLRNLTHLNLSHNAIASLKNLENLRNLQILNLSNNRITKLEGLDKQTKLIELDVSSNNIQTIPLPFIKKLPSLRRFRVAENRIDSLHEVTKLKFCQSLTDLDVEGNPLTTIEHWRAAIIFHIRSISVIDRRSVTEADRIDADGRLGQTEILDLESRLAAMESQLKSKETSLQESQADNYRLYDKVANLEFDKSELSTKLGETATELEYKSKLLKRTMSEKNWLALKHTEMERQLGYYKLDLKFSTIPDPHDFSYADMSVRSEFDVTESNSASEIPDTAYIGKAMFIPNGFPQPDWIEGGESRGGMSHGPSSRHEAPVAGVVSHQGSRAVTAASEEGMSQRGDEGDAVMKPMSHESPEERLMSHRSVEEPVMSHGSPEERLMSHQSVNEKLMSHENVDEPVMSHSSPNGPLTSSMRPENGVVVSKVMLVDRASSPSEFLEGIVWRSNASIQTESLPPLMSHEEVEERQREAEGLLLTCRRRAAELDLINIKLAQARGSLNQVNCRVEIGVQAELCEGKYANEAEESGLSGENSTLDLSVLRQIGVQTDLREGRYLNEPKVERTLVEEGVQADLREGKYLNEAKMERILVEEGVQCSIPFAAEEIQTDFRERKYAHEHPPATKSVGVSVRSEIQDASVGTDLRAENYANEGTQVSTLQRHVGVSAFPLLFHQEVQADLRAGKYANEQRQTFNEGTQTAAIGLNGDLRAGKYANEATFVNEGTQVSALQSSVAVSVVPYSTHKGIQVDLRAGKYANEQRQIFNEGTQTAAIGLNDLRAGKYANEQRETETFNEETQTDAIGLNGGLRAGKYGNEFKSVTINEGTQTEDMQLGLRAGKYANERRPSVPRFNEGTQVSALQTNVGVSACPLSTPKGVQTDLRAGKYANEVGNGLNLSEGSSSSGEIEERIREELMELRSNLNEETIEAREKLESLLDEIDCLEGTLTKRRVELRDAQRLVAEACVTLRERNSDVTELMRRRSNLLSDVENLERQQQAKEDQLYELENETDRMDVALMEKRQIIANIMEYITERQVEINGLDSACTQAQADLSRLAEELKITNDALNAKKVALRAEEVVKKVRLVSEETQTSAAPQRAEDDLMTHRKFQLAEILKYICKKRSDLSELEGNCVNKGEELEMLNKRIQERIAQLDTLADQEVKVRQAAMKKIYERIQDLKEHLHQEMETSMMHYDEAEANGNANNNNKNSNNIIKRSGSGVIYQIVRNQSNILRQALEGLATELSVLQEADETIGEVMAPDQLIEGVADDEGSLRTAESGSSVETAPVISISSDEEVEERFGTRARIDIMSSVTVSRGNGGRLKGGSRPTSTNSVASLPVGGGPSRRRAARTGSRQSQIDLNNDLMAQADRVARDRYESSKSLSELRQKLAIVENTVCGRQHRK